MLKIETFPNEEVVYIPPDNDGFEVPKEAIAHAMECVRKQYPYTNLFRVDVLVNENAEGNKKYIAIVYKRTEI